MCFQIWSIEQFHLVMTKQAAFTEQPSQGRVTLRHAERPHLGSRSWQAAKFGHFLFANWTKICHDV